MAESRRKAENANPSLDDEAQKKKDRLFLIIFFSGLVAAVIAIIFLSKFLSNT